MKKSHFALVGLVAIVVGFLLFLSGAIPGAISTPKLDESVDRTESSKAAFSRSEEQAGAPSSAVGQGTRVRLSRGALAREAEVDDARQREGQVLEARDIFYDRLLAIQGHDRRKEEQLHSRLMGVLSEKEDALVGEIGCSPEFCRVELRGVGNVNVLRKYGREIIPALDPKGFKFTVSATGEQGDLITSYYFGRDDSWTIPDFHAYGLL